MENNNEINLNLPEKKPRFSKNTIFIILVIFIAAIVLYNMTDNNTIGEENNMAEGQKVKLETNHGDIVIMLYDDMPITTGNFVSLAEKGTYNEVIFHRIIDGFMVQGGDPTGTGFGDPSIPNIEDEFTHAGGNRNKVGTISMANAGPNTGSSQFFINLVDNSFLDTKHPAFGSVVKGMDIVEKIAKVATDPADKPIEEVKIIKASLI